MNTECLVNINPDGMGLEDITKLCDDFIVLTDYLKCKTAAVRARTNGAIEHAIEYEKECDRIYKNLPESVKSW